MRSFGLFSTKPLATFLSDSIRFGFRSLASMEPETSIDITMSIPFVVLVLLLISTVRGRANATIINPIASILSKNKKGFNLDNKLGFAPKADTLLIFSVTDCWFLFQICQPIKRGIMANNQKNMGLRKVILFIGCVYF